MRWDGVLHSAMADEAAPSPSLLNGPLPSDGEPCAAHVTLASSATAGVGQRAEPDQANAGAFAAPYIGGRTKRTLDILVSVLLLAFFSPLMLLVALLVRLTSPGGAFFVQPRGGRGGRTFRLLKFRSMYVQNPSAEVVQARRNDDRITPIGRIIRATSADELPQLLNVLAGDMSLVGPRPHAVDHDRFYSEQIGNYVRRFDAKPGITGLAQTTGLRGETPTADVMQRRVDADLEYIRTACLTQDLKIIAKTAMVVLADRNAY